MVLTLCYCQQAAVVVITRDFPLLLLIQSKGSVICMLWRIQSIPQISRPGSSCLLGPGHSTQAGGVL